MKWMIMMLDWPQILALDEVLVQVSPSPVVTLNRAVAVAMVDGPRAGLAVLGGLDADDRMAHTHRLEAVRAHLLELSGEPGAARDAYRRAARMTASLPEQRYLALRAARRGDAPPGAPYIDGVLPPRRQGWHPACRTFPRRPGSARGGLVELRPGIAVSVTDRRRPDAIRSAAEQLAAASAAGLIGGFLLGGIGGRLAMLVLRLTSDPSLHGLPTDDDFTIGIVSGATVFLVGFTTLLGVMGGLVYLVVRAWLPERARPWLFGALTGLVGGAEVIRPGGIDFTLLEPLWLAVAMFVLLPAAYGVLVSRLAERFLRSDSRFRGSRAALVGGLALIPFVLLLLAGFSPVGVAILIAAVVALVVGARAPHLASEWSSPPIRWLGRGLLAAVGVGAAIVLVGDIAEIL